jgi:DnaK suppressor protein
MANFTKDQMTQIELKLSGQYQVLLEEVRDELERSGDQQYAELLGRSAADTGDESMADALADINAAMIDRHVSELRNIEEARSKIKEGIFGTCSNCGGEIDPERLLANPTAKRCMTCQEQLEKTYAGQITPTL